MKDTTPPDDPSLQLLKDLIADNAFGGITIDTSIFDREHQKLESGRLAQLMQFKHGRPQFLLSDVVRREMTHHLAKAVREATTSVEKSLREAEHVLRRSAKDLDLAKMSLLPSTSADELSKSRVDEFLEKTKGTIVSSTEFPIMGDVLDRYFDGAAPFGSSKKKNEFLDAIALLSLEGWAKKNDTKVLVVTADDDWIMHCEGSTRLVAINALGTALGLFHYQLVLDSFRVNLAADLADNRRSATRTKIEAAIDNAVWNLDFPVDADSNFYFDEEILKLDVENIRFDALDEGKIKIISAEGDTTVAEIALKITVAMTCELTFYVGDPLGKNKVTMGSSTENMADDIDVNVLIKFNGDVSLPLAKLDASSIEVLSDRHRFNFGRVRPDRSADEQI